VEVCKDNEADQILVRECRLGEFTVWDSVSQAGVQFRWESWGFFIFLYFFCSGGNRKY